MAQKSAASYHHGDLRSALLREAAALIAEAGVEGVTMRSLSQRVGVSRTAPYRHFADKEALLVAVAADGFQALRERLQAAQTGGRSEALVQFEEMGAAYVAFATSHPAHYRLMYGKEALQRDRHPELHEAANAIYDELGALIQRYQEEGVIRSGPAGELAYVAWSTVHGLASLLVDGQMERPDDIDALARLATRVLLEGLHA